ncbi:MAG: histidine kinase dimerization/phospho-acceptor domain-containing protein [Pseudomonadota bacterium]|nr:histidine kinase dimerization/phospho-acceptor domain-containing protein [Pseudomonadota bacterium]
MKYRNFPMQGPESTQSHGSHDATASGPGCQSQGSLLAEISTLLHDLNQPLSAITNYAQAGSHLIANGAADTERLKGLFDKIAAQSARAAAISQELRRMRQAHSGQ